MKIPIVTVCYNCFSDICKTIDSLMAQTFQDFEYIIIDGNSKDGTKEKMYEYSKKFKNCIFVSENDNGIYDAMNKGIDLSHGEYIFFLNIGDILYNMYVLEKVVGYLDGLDIYYGDYILNGGIKRQPEKIYELYWILEKMICHQTIFAKRELLEKNKFNLDYKYCADRYWLMKQIKKYKSTYKHLPLIISEYDSNGFSSNNDAIAKESKIILNEFYPEYLIKLVYIKNKIGKFVRKIIKL